jgi:antitoxin MazE
MQVFKWGDSLAVRLPAAVVEALGLKEGDMLEIQVAGRRVFEVAKAPNTRELLARLRKFRGRLPATFKFDRLERMSDADSFFSEGDNPRAFWDPAMRFRYAAGPSRMIGSFDAHQDHKSQHDDDVH